MSSAARKGVTSRRYIFTKLYSATEEFLHQLFSPQSQAASTEAAQRGLTSAWSQAVSKFHETYQKQMTMTMYIAGAAMSPSLNQKAVTDPEAVEKLVVRKLLRPSSKSVWVGDVVAFNSPLGKPSDDAQVMVRRVVAVEGMEMVSEGSAEEEDFAIPAGHCWVLADNPDLKPPKVIDSRTFGFIPMSNILGRVIYSGTSPTSHAPVTNSPLAQMVDDPVLEQEVVLAGLFDEDEGSKEQEK